MVPIKNQTAQYMSRLHVIRPLSGKCKVSQVRRRVIRSDCRGISFPHCSRSVQIVYQIYKKRNEETLNKQKRIFVQIIIRRQRCCRLILSLCRIEISNQQQTGTTRVNTLIDQGYIAFREQNISKRQAAVRPRGPITAMFLAIKWVNSPLD